MIKKIFFSLVLITLVFSTTACLGSKKEKKEQVTPKNDNEISGFVISATISELYLRYQNRIYYFDIENANQKKVKNLIPGDFVKITYENELNLENEKQDVKVKKLEFIEDENEYKKALFDEGIFKDFYEKAYQKLKKMTLEEKIGQLFLVRVPDNALADVGKYQFGGYILFGKDTTNKTKEMLKNDINSWNSVSKIPLIIASDEEGGTVTRVSSNRQLSPNRFNSPQYVYNFGGMEAIRDDNIKKNNILYDLGINVNLAPVADVSVDEKDYIYKRSFGKNAEETAKFVTEIISSSKGTNVSNVLKHFPGYGNNSDTHTGVAVDRRSIDNFRQNDFIPFISGIKEGAEAILVSHNIIVNIEDNVPASLSFKIHDILRNELSFNGIIMTDDIAMDALKDYENVSLEALKAGNDMIIVTDYEKSINEIKNALTSGAINENLIDESVIHVLAWKYYKNLITENS